VSVISCRGYEQIACQEQPPPLRARCVEVSLDCDRAVVWSCAPATAIGRSGPGASDPGTG